MHKHCSNGHGWSSLHIMHEHCSNSQLSIAMLVGCLELIHIGCVWHNSERLRLCYCSATVAEPGEASQVQLLWLLPCLCWSRSHFFCWCRSVTGCTVRKKAEPEPSEGTPNTALGLSYQLDTDAYIFLNLFYNLVMLLFYFSILDVGDRI
jgi:hypothetical protein